jgi:sugar phosphate isomerase/epimerase
MPRRTLELMERSDLSQRLGLSVPYEWWPSTPLLKEIEAAGFGWVQVPSPPSSVLADSRACARHANALREALATSGLRLILHAPGSLQAGTPARDRALEGLVSYAAEAGAPLVVYHAANFPDALASEDALLAETRSLAAVSGRAERLGVTIALENLAPVFPGPDALSHTPRVLRTMAKRIDSPAIGVCLDVGHAHLVAALRRTDIAELIEPVLDRVAVFHLHDNLGARRGGEARPELDPVRLDLHLPLGRGNVPWDRVAPLLGRAPAAPLLLEVHPPRPAPSRLIAGALGALAPQVPARA